MVSKERSEHEYSVERTGESEGKNSGLRLKFPFERLALNAYQIHAKLPGLAGNAVPNRSLIFFVKIFQDQGDCHVFTASVRKFADPYRLAPNARYG
jgi:hypothetical protein